MAVRSVPRDVEFEILMSVHQNISNRGVGDCSFPPGAGSHIADQSGSAYGHLGCSAPLLSIWVLISAKPALAAAADKSFLELPTGPPGFHNMHEMDSWPLTVSFFRGF